MQLFTIGFTKSSAESFFTRMRDAGVKRLVDVRLNNVSQLAGFAKRDDLAYFTRELCHAGYMHDTRLAPTQQMLDEYKKLRGSWDAYAEKFNALMHARKIEDDWSADELDGACLLCSEDKPHHCHRRLVAEYLQQQWPQMRVVHL